MLFRALSFPGKYPVPLELQEAVVLLSLDFRPSLREIDEMYEDDLAYLMLAKSVQGVMSNGGNLTF